MSPVSAVCVMGLSIAAVAAADSNAKLRRLAPTMFASELATLPTMLLRACRGAAASARYGSHFRLIC